MDNNTPDTTDSANIRPLRLTRLRSIPYGGPGAADASGPKVPEYCRATPTECVPFFANPVSSMITTPSPTLARATIVAIRKRYKELRQIAQRSCPRLQHRHTASPQ